MRGNRLSRGGDPMKTRSQRRRERQTKISKTKRAERTKKRIGRIVARRCVRQEDSHMSSIMESYARRRKAERHAEREVQREKEEKEEEEEEKALRATLVEDTVPGGNVIRPQRGRQEYQRDGKLAGRNNKSDKGHNRYQNTKGNDMIRRESNSNARLTKRPPARAMSTNRDDFIGGKHHGLTVYPLRDVLSRVPLPLNCPLDGVSNKWRCVIAPKMNDIANPIVPEEETMRFLDEGIPCRLGRWRSLPVYDVTGSDGMAFLTDPRWNHFPKPKIAFKAGWAGPGTRMESPQYHKLITSFREVFHHSRDEGTDIDPLATAITPKEMNGETEEEDEVEDDTRNDDVAALEILNLQMFHRHDDAICPPIPVLAEKLVWPSFLDDGAICDNATRVSQRGAITWWHLDDSGEFVEQTGLPLPLSDEMKFPSPVASLPLERQRYFDMIDKELYCSTECDSSVPVKLFLYGPKESYDWFMHDDESAVSGKVAALNIFATPDEALPNDPTLLPIICVAVLESGGRPLISPPNIPHVVVTVNNCVMVEQRRVAHLFLDEISYFLQKCSFWSGNPIVYEYIEKDLQDESYVGGQLIPMLMETFASHSGLNPYEETVRRRVVMALFSIATFEKHYKLAEDSRRALLALLLEGNKEMTTILHTPRIPCGTRIVSLAERLKEYWDVRQYWPKPGSVFRVPLLTPPNLLPRAILDKCGHSPEVHWFLPVVYSTISSPVYGSEKNSVEEVASEYFSMESIGKRTSDLFAFLRVRKGERDVLLDELF